MFDLRVNFAKGTFSMYFLLGNDFKEAEKCLWHPLNIIDNYDVTKL